jgi:hypothetical protein
MRGIYGPQAYATCIWFSTTGPPARRDHERSDDETQGRANASQVIVYNLPGTVTVDFLQELFGQSVLQSEIKSKVGPSGDSYT